MQTAQGNSLGVSGSTLQTRARLETAKLCDIWQLAREAS